MLTRNQRGKGRNRHILGDWEWWMARQIEWTTNQRWTIIFYWANTQKRNEWHWNV